MQHSHSLHSLGWRAFFQQQLSLDEWHSVEPVRVLARHRSHLQLITGSLKGLNAPITPRMPPLVAGDWLLLDAEGRFIRALDRHTEFTRKAPGTRHAVQLLAANIDVVWLVTALNRDFNLNRTERQLALVHDAGAQAVLVCSKADLCAQTEDKLAEIAALDPQLPVHAVNALDADSVKFLEHWCQVGTTLALLGSSGVGKTTLINTLSGTGELATQPARADDDKGRHTTTSRSLHRLPGGALVLDTPGLREWQLDTDAQAVRRTFKDIDTWARQCRFSDCRHAGEPGCAVQAAIEAGSLDARRLRSHNKLLAEQQRNQATLQQTRARERTQGRLYRRIQRDKNARKDG